MQHTKRSKAVSIPIAEETRVKLADYIRSQAVRPVTADVVTEAVEQWLAREGKGKRENHTSQLRQLRDRHG